MTDARKRLEQLARDIDLMSLTEQQYEMSIDAASRFFAEFPDLKDRMTLGQRMTVDGWEAVASYLRGLRR